jgi:hypothetical protein
MRRSTCCLLVVLFGSWLSGSGQSAPKLTSPKIVATFERIGQTAEIPPTVIYTPPKWGTFRVSMVMVLTVGNGSTFGAWGPLLYFYDGSGKNQGGGADVTANTPQTADVEFPIRAHAGKPLTFAVSSSGDTSGSKYNIWVVVEQLM